jgi:hypothetical protein
MFFQKTPLSRSRIDVNPPNISSDNLTKSLQITKKNGLVSSQDEPIPIRSRKLSSPYIFESLGDSRPLNNPSFKHVLAANEEVLKKQSKSNMDFHEENMVAQSVDLDNQDDQRSGSARNSSARMNRRSSIPYQMVLNDRLNTIDESSTERKQSIDSRNYDARPQPTAACCDTQITYRPLDDEAKKSVVDTKPMVKPTIIITNPSKQTVVIKPKKPNVASSISTTHKTTNDALKQKIQKNNLAIKKSALIPSKSTETANSKLQDNNHKPPSQNIELAISPSKSQLSRPSSMSLEITSNKIHLKAKESVSQTPTATQQEPQVPQKTLNYLQSMTMFYGNSDTKVYEMFDDHPHPMTAKPTIKPQSTFPKKISEISKSQKTNHNAAIKKPRKKDGTKKLTKKPSKTKKQRKNSNNTVVANGTGDAGAPDVDDTNDSMYNNDYEDDDFEAETSGVESEMSVDSTARTTTVGIDVGEVSGAVLQRRQSNAALAFNNFTQIPLQQTNDLSQKFLYSKEAKLIESADDGLNPGHVEPITEDLLENSCAFEAGNNRIVELQRQIFEEKSKVISSGAASVEDKPSVEAGNANSMSIRSSSNIHKVYSVVNSLSHNQDADSKSDNPDAGNYHSLSASKLPPKALANKWQNAVRNMSLKNVIKPIELPLNLSNKINSLIGNMQNMYVERHDGASEEQNDDEATGEILGIMDSKTIKNALLNQKALYVSRSGSFCDLKEKFQFLFVECFTGQRGQRNSQIERQHGR